MHRKIDLSVASHSDLNTSRSASKKKLTVISRPVNPRLESQLHKKTVIQNFFSCGGNRNP